MSTELIKKLTAELGSSAETIERLILALESAEAEIEQLRRSEAFHVEACAAHQLHIDELRAIVDRQHSAIKSAIKIAPCWLPECVPDEHAGEGEALHAMSELFREVAESVQKQLDTGDAGEGTG